MPTATPLTGDGIERRLAHGHQRRSRLCRTRLADDVIVVTGTTGLELDDYDVQPPTAPIVVSIVDTATIEWQLFLTPA